VQESLDAIGEALAENGKVIVTGCLGAKRDGGAASSPGASQGAGVTGPHALDEVMGTCTTHLPRPHDPFTDLVPPAGIKLTPAPLRLPEDLRRLQPPLQLLHHSVDARRPGQPADRRGDARGGGLLKRA
jgi:tRNA A37 methylthiotransferase MiaB